jgi:hypothetical protein
VELNVLQEYFDYRYGKSITGYEGLTRTLQQGKDIIVVNKDQTAEAKKQAL